MKAGGVLVIGDRDRLSIIGLLKPFIEAAAFGCIRGILPFRSNGAV